MKKIYSLVGAVILAASLNAQMTVFSANFDDVTGTGGNDGSWSGTIAATAATASNGFVYDSVYKGDRCLKVGTGSKAGSVTTPSLTQLSGVATLSFRAGAWDGSSEKLVLNLSITGGGTLDKTSVTLTKGSFNTFTAGITGGTANTKLVFTSGATSNSRFFIDDIVVSAPSAAVGDVNATKVNFIKNTLVDNSILFVAKADIQIVNMNGQVVKTAAVNENTSLDVAALPKGMYVVTAIVNGKTVSEKIMIK